jgi:hypothetical protein
VLIGFLALLFLRPAQLMAVGGNHKARQFFNQHGWDETGSDKIEGKVRRGRGCCWSADATQCAEL